MTCHNDGKAFTNSSGILIVIFAVLHLIFRSAFTYIVAFILTLAFALGLTSIYIYEHLQKLSSLPLNYLSQAKNMTNFKQTL